MSSRRWFWALLLAAMLWGWVGGKTATKPGDSHTPASLMQQTQGIVGEYLIKPLLTPAQFIFTRVQGFATWAIDTTTTRNTGESVRDLHRRIDDLQAELDESHRLQRLSQERFDELKA